MSREKPVFSFLFAHYHGPWEWEYVRQMLAERGIDSIAPDLPIEDPSKNLDDFAKIYRKAQEEKGAASYIDVAHSWSGDIISRQLGSLSLSQRIYMQVYIAAPLKPVLEQGGLPQDSPLLNSRTLWYDTMVQIEQMQNGEAEFDPVLVSNAFYNDVNDKVLRALAIGSLRQHPHVPQPKDDKNAVLPPDIPKHFIGLRQDKTFIYDNQVATARFLNLEFSSLDTGHFPMLSRPDLVLDRLLEIVEIQEKKDSKQAINRGPLMTIG